MKRVAIVGPGGAGKSWLAVELGRRLGLEVVHLDQHYWRPGWVEPPAEEWRAQHAALLSGRDEWVADGNYGSTLADRFERADTVIFLDPHPLLALARVLKRESIGPRVGTPQDRSRLDRSFFEFLHWIWSYRRTRRGPMLERLAVFEGEIHVLRTRRDVERFLGAV